MAGIYLNTDVASMITALQVRKTNDRLNNTMLQQTTGLKINYAIDDPSGLVASEVMRGEMASISAAKANSERAIGMFKVTDQALGLISDKLVKAKELATSMTSDTTDFTAANNEFTDIMKSIGRDINTTTYNGNKIFFQANAAGDTATTIPAAKFQVGTDGSGVVTFQQKNLALAADSPNIAKLVSYDTSATATGKFNDNDTVGTDVTGGYGRGLAYDLSAGTALVLSNPTDKTTAKNNATAAIADIDKAITEIAQYRGQVGGFQKYTLESSINSLDNRFTQVTAAEASIRNADATQLTQDITSGQLLLQAGISTLLLAGQNRGYAAALLG